MNFTLGNFEKWGPDSRSDPLSYFFDLFIQEHHLIDILSAKVKPTWSNKRLREGQIAKTLDHFLIKEGLTKQNLNFRQWENLTTHQFDWKS